MGWYKYKEPPTLAERFFSKLKHNPETGCWEWTASRTRCGYGHLRDRGVLMLAHRVSWQMHRGDIGDLFVCHRCNNPRCVNPEHLYLGTNQENIADAIKDGIFGSVLTAGDVRVIRALRDAGGILPRWRRSGDADGVSISDLARQFGASYCTIWSVLRDRSWKWVT